MLRPSLSIHASAFGTLLLVGALGASARDLVRFEHLTIDSGLSQNDVTAALQNSLGFLWVGTSGGLNRYDGYEFVVFQFDPTDTTSITDNRITALLETADSTLWVGTADGLFRYDPDSVAFTANRHNRRNEATLAFNSISTLHEDASGRIWIGHADAEDPEVEGISRLDPHSGQAERLAISSRNEATSAYAFAETPDGTIWVGTADGLLRYDAAADTFTTLRHDPAEPNSLAGNDVRELFVDSVGRLWVGLWREGLDCYDPASGIVDHHKPGPTSIELSSGYLKAHRLLRTQARRVRARSLTERSRLPEAVELRAPRNERGAGCRRDERISVEIKARDRSQIGDSAPQYCGATKRSAERCRRRQDDVLQHTPRITS